MSIKEVTAYENEAGKIFKTKDDLIKDKFKISIYNILKNKTIDSNAAWIWAEAVVSCWAEISILMKESENVG